MPADAAFRDYLTRAAQDWLMRSGSIPAKGQSWKAWGSMIDDLLDESPADFMERIIEDMVKIDAWNK